MRDPAKLNELGKVTFDKASVEDLFVWVEVWDHEVRVVYPPEKERYRKAKAITKRVAAAGYKWQAPDYVDWGGADFDERTWDRYLLGLLASNIYEVWKRCGGKTTPGTHSHGGWVDRRLSADGEWGGPVPELMLELMKQIGVQAKHQPSRSAIRDAMIKFPWDDKKDGEPK